MTGAVAMTDGSFKDDHATAAWGVKQNVEDDRYVARDTTVSSGHPIIQSAYRSELTGILALVRAVNAASLGAEPGQGHVEVGCDCLSAITVVTQEWEPRPTSTLQGDLVYSIQREIEQSPVGWRFRHVRGHQDDGSGLLELDGWARMNIDMDAAAKEAWEETKQLPKKRDGAVPWRIEIGTEHIVNGVRERIVRHATTRAESDRRCLKDSDWEARGELIDKRATEEAMRSLTKTRRVWATKWHFGQYAHGVNMKRWGRWGTDECPRCHKRETAAHLLRCMDKGSGDRWETAVKDLENWMKRKGTAPEIVRVFMEGIRKWRSPLWHPASRPRNFMGILEAAGNQEKVGWERLFYGELAIGWVETQQRYNEWVRNRRSARRWGAELVKKCLEIAWDQWQHRNGILHDVEQARSDKQRREKTEKGIRDEYGRGARGLPETERAMVRGGIERVLRMTVGARELWVRSIQAGRRVVAARRRETDNG